MHNFLKKIENFGLHFGEIFQLVDDILDHDHPNGEESAQRELEVLKATIENELKSFPGNIYLLDYLVQVVLSQKESKETTGV